MADLTETQRKSLDDFRQITASEDVDQARTLLERSDWNLETAISSVYDDHDQDPQAEDLSRGSDVVHEPLLGGGAGSASSRSSRSGTSRGGGASPSTGFGRVRVNAQHPANDARYLSETRILMYSCTFSHRSSVSPSAHHPRRSASFSSPSTGLSSSASPSLPSSSPSSFASDPTCPTSPSTWISSASAGPLMSVAGETTI